MGCMSCCLWRICKDLLAHGLCTFSVGLGVNHLQYNWSCDMPAEMMIAITAQRQERCQSQQREGHQSLSLPGKICPLSLLLPLAVCSKRTALVPHKDFFQSGHN